MSIVVYTGPMKSGKSEEMLKIISRKKIFAKKKVLMIKPDTDTRFADDINKSRDNRSEECVVIPSNNPEYIYPLLDEYIKVIAIDEIQFFKNPNIINIVQDLNDKGYEIFIAGLDMTSERKPFGYMPQIMAIADNVIKLKAVCEFCRNENAVYTFADFNKTEDIAIGDEKYKAVCKECYLKYSKKRL